MTCDKGCKSKRVLRWSLADLHLEYTRWRGAEREDGPFYLKVPQAFPILKIQFLELVLKEKYCSKGIARQQRKASEHQNPQGAKFAMSLYTNCLTFNYLKELIMEIPFTVNGTSALPVVVFQES